MSGDPVIGDGVRPASSPPTEPDKALHLPAAQLRALTEVLAEGGAVSARVVQALGDNQYQLAVRGRTVVAESALPLANDSVVRIQLVVGGTQPTLRLLDLPAAFDLAQTSATPARVQALGLPPTPAALAAVTAFESGGAPLDPARLRHAVEQSAPLPPAEAATCLRSLALIARADLPATPALIALAGHAITQGGERALPNPAAAVLALRQVAQPPTRLESVPAGTVTLEPDLATTVTAPAVTSAQASTNDPRKPIGGQVPQFAGQPVSPTGLPVTDDAGADRRSPASTQVPPGAPPSSPLLSTQLPSASLPTAVASPQALQSSSLPHSPQASLPSSPPAGVQSSQTPSPTLSTGQQSVPISQASIAAGPVPVADRPSAPGVPLPLASGATALVVGEQPSASLVGQTAARRSLPVPVSSAVLLRDLLTEPLPDLELGGVEAAKRALTLAGVRPRAEPGDEPSTSSPSTTLAQRVAALPLHDQPGSPSVPHPLADTAVRLTRELAAETVFKSDDLADYDRVFALPITVHGQPVPARLAVAERQTTGGKATFVRVDTDLSALGEVSVRLSGVEGGSLAVTLLASGSGGRALADGLPALVDALRHLGIIAAVRVADPMVEDHG